MYKTSGLDFGTTNSCIGVNDGKSINMIPLSENNKIITKTAIAYDFEDKEFYVGDDAVLGVINGDIVGRLVRSPKSFLSSKEEPTTFLGGKRRNLTEIISMIISEFREKASMAINDDINSVLVGRPVFFDEDNLENDRNAESRLYNAVKKAGYKDVLFMEEPVAAAISIINKIPHDNKEKIIMVADLGGGTSDFSLIKVSDNRESYEVLGNNGFYKGGDYIDQQFSLHSFGSYLGKDLSFTPEASSATSLHVPTGAYSLIGDRKMVGRIEKHQIKVMKEVQRLVSQPKLIGRVIEILSDSDIGHLYLDMIEQNKIALSSNELISGKTSFLSSDFHFSITRNQFENNLGRFIENLSDGLLELEKRCGIKLNSVDHVFISGGTGLIPVARSEILKNIGEDKEFLGGNSFSAIGEGLTIESQRIFSE